MRVNFPWCDAFRPSKRTAQANIHFEKAAILFNIAAVLSQQALQVERGTPEGITQACKLFQVLLQQMHHMEIELIKSSVLLVAMILTGEQSFCWFASLKVFRLHCNASFACAPAPSEQHSFAEYGAMPRCIAPFLQLIAAVFPDL